MSHSCVEIYIHLIFSTKDRSPLIFPEIEQRLYGYIIGIAKNNKVSILEINGTFDHIHILFKMQPDVVLSKFIKEIKSYSSGWMKRILGEKDFYWQEGYGAFSCSSSHVRSVIEYIKNQKIHHQSISLNEEIDRINKKWGITLKL